MKNQFANSNLKMNKINFSSASVGLIKPAVIITLFTGIYLHFTRLFIDTNLLIKYIYTATFDIVFAIPMTVGAVAIIPAWKYFSFRNKFEKIIIFMTGVYFTASVPLHIQTWISQSTEYIRIFPMWYSYLFLSYTSVMLIVWSKLKIKAQTSVN